jgi:hypothetical protein
MQAQYDDRQRQTPEYFDQLQIYKARIVSKPEPGDDRLQVRIIPHMVDIPEKDLLPTWPPFFRGQVIVGKTEAIDQKNADYVWCAALPDFSVGFILGLANTYEGQDKYAHSYNYKDLVQSLMKRGVVSSTMNYKDLYVQYWTDDYLEMVNFRTGDKFIIQSNGNMIVMEQNQIYLRVGSGDSSETADNPNAAVPPFSAIRMSRKEISIATPHLRVRASQITLGDKGLNVLGSASPIPIHAEGATIHPQTSIKV